MFSLKSMARMWGGINLSCRQWYEQVATTNRNISCVWKWENTNIKWKALPCGTLGVNCFCSVLCDASEVVHARIYQWYLRSSAYDRSGGVVFLASYLPSTSVAGLLGNAWFTSCPSSRCRASLISEVHECAWRWAEINWQCRGKNCRQSIWYWWLSR